LQAEERQPLENIRLVEGIRERVSKKLLEEKAAHNIAETEKIGGRKLRTTCVEDVRKGKKQRRDDLGDAALTVIRT